MTYTLYSRTGTGGFIVEAALAKAGADFEVVEIDTSKGEQNSSEYLAINPMGQVPALRAPDGAVLTESAAMVIHLANVFPDQGLAPKPATSAHAAFLRWMFFMAINLYEGDVRYYYTDRYTTDPQGLEGVKEAAAAHMSKSFAIVEEALGKTPYLCGEALSIGDVYLSMLMNWCPVDNSTAGLARVKQAVLDDPVYGPIWRAHGFKV